MTRPRDERPTWDEMCDPLRGELQSTDAEMRIVSARGVVERGEALVEEADARAGLELAVGAFLEDADCGDAEGFDARCADPTCRFCVLHRAYYRLVDASMRRG